MILVSFLKASQQWSLVASCDVFVVRVWTSFIYNKTISSHVLCFQANILLVYLWLHFGYLVPSCCNYFGCTSFFVDIYHHDLVYLEPYTLERNYIPRWYPFFHVHLVFLLFFLSGASVKAFALSACLLSLHLDALLCVVKIIFLMLIFTRLLPS